MWQIWLILAGIFFVIEIATVGFLVFWFAIGALITMVISLFTTNIVFQCTIFVISSTILLFFTRKLANRITNGENVKTNAFSIIGKKGIVIKDIEPITGKGQIKIGTEVWSAKSLENRKIETGIEIEVVEIDGVKAIVK